MDQVFGVSWSGGAATSVAYRPTMTGDTSIESEFTLGTGTVTDQEQQIGFDVANVQGLLIVVEDNESTVVLETNATDATGGQTFTFPIGGGVLFWNADFPTTCPISTDVTTTYWTKTGASTPSVSIRLLFNA
jgi:hypothetical protein